MAHVRVRITRTGFIGNQLRKVGDELTLADEKYVSKTWMQVIAFPSKTPPDEPAPDPESDSAGSKSKRNK